MSSLAQVTTAVHSLLTTIAETAAISTACVQRVRCFTGPTWIQTLVLGCLATPSPSLTDLAQTAATFGVAVTPQAIARRFTPETVACLDDVLQAAIQQHIAADPVAIPLLTRFAGVYVLDTSTIRLPPAVAACWPGCGNGAHHPAAALKVGVRLDLVRGTLTGPLLDPGRTHDLRCAVTAAPLPAGSLRIADLGFWSVPALAEIATQQGFWLSRLQAQTAVLTPAGDRLELDAVLRTTTASCLDLDVLLSAATRLPARLLAQRVPAEVAAIRRRRIRDDAKRRGTTPRQSRLQRAEWLLLVTNVPAERLTLPEAVVLMRARWQIELLFKRWKSQGQIDEARSANPWRVLAELYAKLIAMVLQHWACVLGCWELQNRSLVKAAAVVRRHALAIGLALPQRRQLRQVLTRVIAAVACSGTQNPRRTHPNLSRLLRDIEERALS